MFKRKKEKKEASRSDLESKILWRTWYDKICIDKGIIAKAKDILFEKNGGERIDKIKAATSASYIALGYYPKQEKKFQPQPWGLHCPVP